MKYITGILTTGLLLFIFLQLKSCKDISNMTAELISVKADTKTKDSVSVKKEDSIINENYQLNIALWDKDREYSHVIDSFKFILTGTKSDLKFYNYRVLNLLDTIRAYGRANKDSMITNYADSLEALRAGVQSEVVYVYATNDQKDSVFNARHQLDSMTLVLKDSIIADLHRNYNVRGDIINEFQAALDKAIKSGKRQNILNVLRSIGEAILVVALLIKK